MEVLTDEFPLSGKQNFTFEKHPQKLLQCQTVIGKEACRSKGGGAENAQPACRLLSYDLKQQQINGGGKHHRRNTAKELPQGQTEENGFLVLGYFFWNFDFDCFHLVKFGNLTDFLENEII